MMNKGDGIQVNKKEIACYYKMTADKRDPNAMFSYQMRIVLA